MLCHVKKLSIKQGLKTQYFVILKKISERITIAVLLWQQPIKVRTSYNSENLVACS